jgi:hypothetical protein
MPDIAWQQMGKCYIDKIKRKAEDIDFEEIPNSNQVRME